jgi:hypothetical protein
VVGQEAVKEEREEQKGERPKKGSCGIEACSGAAAVGSVIAGFLFAFFFVAFN